MKQGTREMLNDIQDELAKKVQAAEKTVMRDSLLRSIDMIEGTLRRADSIPPGAGEED